MLIVLRGELIVCKECNGVAWTFLIKLYTPRKDLDRYIRIIPKLHRQHVACEMPGWQWDQCSNAEGRPRRSETFQHFSIPPPVRYRTRHNFDVNVSAGVVSLAWMNAQAIGGLCAPMLMAIQP